MRADKTIKLMKRARLFADRFSKDQSTKVGAFFADSQDFTVLSRGYNGMPRGVRETPERNERPLKYACFEHGERNAIYNLARFKLKGSIAVTTSVPSTSCVRALISVGVSEVVCPAPKWVEDLALAIEFFKETGVGLTTLESGSFSRLQCFGPLAPDKQLRKLRAFMGDAQDLRDVMCKDPNGNATVFLSPGDYTSLTEGYSGMPRGGRDGLMERYTGAERANWVEESVRNAIYNCVRPELKSSTALVTATTCVECARGIVGVGCQEVVYVEPEPEFAARWAQSMATALQLLTEFGVAVTALPPDFDHEALSESVEELPA